MIKKIYIIVPSIDVSGPIKGAIDLINSLSTKYDFFLVGLKGVEQNLFFGKLKKISVINLQNLSYTQKILKMREIIISSGLTRHEILILSYCFSADLFTYFLKQYAVTVSSIRGHLIDNYRIEYGWFGYFFAFIQFKIVSGFNEVIVMSRSMEKHFNIFSKKKPLVIGNFVNEDTLLQYRKVKKNPKFFKFIFVGRLSRIKNPLLLIKSFIALSKIHTCLKLEIYGDGNLLNSLQEYVNKNSVHKNINFKGFKSNVWLSASDADCLVLPSLSEGISRAALESLCIGIPVIMKDIPCNQELIKDKSQGLLFNNENSLISCMEAIISNKSKEKKNLLDNEFSKKNCVKKYIIFLNSLDHYSDKDFHNNTSYFDYLCNRSYKSLIYRNYFLYPKITKKISGLTLDYGCGIGDFLKYYKNSIGVDISEEAIEHCRNKGFNVRLIKKKLLPFEDNFFDSVVMDNVLEHIHKPNEIINEIKRVLKNKGRLVIGVPGVKGYISDLDHCKYYNENDLKLIAELNCFKVIEVFNTPLNFSFLNLIMEQFCTYIILENEK